MKPTTLEFMNSQDDITKINKELQRGKREQIIDPKLIIDKLKTFKKKRLRQLAIQEIEKQPEEKGEKQISDDEIEVRVPIAELEEVSPEREMTERTEPTAEDAPVVVSIKANGNRDSLNKPSW